jgi:ABC-type molybdate transport system substrate-binding protein
VNVAGLRFVLLWCAGCLIGGTAFSVSAAAWTSPAPDVVLYCTPALDRALHQVAAQFSTRSGVRVHIFVASPDGLVGLLQHRARADLVAADAATLQLLVVSKLVTPDSVVTLGSDRFVLIAKAGGGTSQTLAGRPTVVTDPTSAAEFDGAAVLAQALLPAAGVVGVADTPTVIATVRAGNGLVGLVHQTQSGAPGIALAAVLPVAPTPIEAGRVVNGQSGRAGDLLAFIAGAEGLAALAHAGLEVRS